MGWLTNAGTAAVRRYSPVPEKRWRLYGASGWQYSTRTITATVQEYTALAYATAVAKAATLNYDNTDQDDIGTRSTAEVVEQNEAGAYKVVQTIQVNGAWSAWA